jgi:putative ABC transport system permease protein
MSQDNLETHFPTTSEYRHLLFKLKAGSSASSHRTAAELERELHNYGLDASVISDQIRENRAYESSFMVLFQAFLGLGLIIGVVGLGVVSARAVRERRYEIGVIRAIGFTREMVMKAFLIELTFIGLLAIFLGLFVGILSSYLAFGAWTGGNFEYVIPWVELILLAAVIYLATLFSTTFPAYQAANITPVEALQRVG